MKGPTVDVDAFIRQRDALIERRHALAAEIERIDEALKPLMRTAPPKPRSNRRRSSKASQIEAFVAANPNCLLSAVTKGTGIENGRVSTALTNLWRGGRLTRTHTDDGWAYRVNERPEIEKAGDES